MSASIGSTCIKDSCISNTYAIDIQIIFAIVLAA